MWLSLRVARMRQVEICGEMTIELSTPAAAHALADYLERCGCTVAFASERVLDVRLPARSQSPREARIEMHAYLRVWRAMNTGHDVTLLEDA
jgi:hypothetical protein